MYGSMENSQDGSILTKVFGKGVMSPWLFNIYIDGIIREAMDEFVGGVQLSNTKVQVLLFVDDIVMVTERKEDIQRNLEVLKAAMDKWEMKMHLGKTKVMVVSRVEGDVVRQLTVRRSKRCRV